MKGTEGLRKLVAVISVGTTRLTAPVAASNWYR